MLLQKKSRMTSLHRFHSYTKIRWTRRVHTSCGISFNAAAFENAKRECDWCHKFADNDRSTSASMGSTVRYGTHNLSAVV